MAREGGIIIVGPCASGKTSLAEKLTEAGYPARQVAQEHSYVPTLWQKMSQPDVLIFLDSSFETSTRRKSLNWDREEYETQQERLGHARKHCDIYINTDDLSEHEVLEKALAVLQGGQSSSQSL
ncbi:MAG: hypothetical protein ACLFWD_07820 [Anaerolineales bacterium]